MFVASVTSSSAFNSVMVLFLIFFSILLQGVGSDMKDPFEAYRKSKSYSFIGSRIGKYVNDKAVLNFLIALVLHCHVLSNCDCKKVHDTMV